MESWDLKFAASGASSSVEVNGVVVPPVAAERNNCVWFLASTA